MPNTYDVRISGVDLNNAWSGVDVFNGRRLVPQRRSAAVVVSGMPGTTAQVGEFESGQFSISVWVKGDRGTEATRSFGNLDANIDRILSGLVLPGLIVVEWLASDGKWRWAYCRTTTITTPEIDYKNSFARITAAFEIPGSFWRGDEMTATYGTFNVPVMTSLASTATAPVQDATIIISGPASNVTISGGGAGVSWTGTINLGQSITFDNAALRAYGPTGSSIATMIRQTSPRYFDVLPGSPTTIVAGGTTSASSWTISGRPAYT